MVQCLGRIGVGDLVVRTAHSGRNVVWHWQCFVCVECHQLLVDYIYFYSTRNESVYCGRHYAETVRPRCDLCDEVKLIFYMHRDWLILTAETARGWAMERLCPRPHPQLAD